MGSEIRRTTNVVTPPRTTNTSPNTGQAKAAGDYTVKKGDTLWSIAKQLVEQSGAKPTSANVARALADLKAANPDLCTPARNGGNKIFPGDSVTFPKAGAWQARSPTANGATNTDQTHAKEQMAALETAKTEQEAQARQALEMQLGRFADFVANSDVTPGQKDKLREFLSELETKAPELLDTPQAQLLMKKVGAPDASTSPESLLADFQRASEFFKNQPMTPELAQHVRDLLAVTQQRAPELLNRPEVKDLMARVGAMPTDPTAALLASFQSAAAYAQTHALTPEQRQRAMELLTVTQRDAPELLERPEVRQLAAQVGFTPDTPGTRALLADFQRAVTSLDTHTLTPQQRETAMQMLAAAQRDAPHLLQRPEGQALMARLGISMSQLASAAG